MDDGVKAARLTVEMPDGEKLTYATGRLFALVGMPDGDSTVVMHGRLGGPHAAIELMKAAKALMPLMDGRMRIDALIALVEMVIALEESGEFDRAGDRMRALAALREMGGDR